MHKKRRTKSAAQNSTVKNIAVKTLLGSAAGIVLFFALTLLAALILWKKDADESVYKYVIFVLSALSGFAGGFVAVRPVRKNGLVIGALSSLPTCAAAVTSAVAVSKSGLSAAGWIFIAVNVFFSALGGIVAANKRK